MSGEGVTCYDCSRTPNLAEDGHSSSAKEMEFLVDSYLENVGISLLCELDVLVFVCRHGTSLTRTEEIARLIGYESIVVSGSLDRLEREKLIERSQPSGGVRFHRISASTDAGRRSCLQQLVSLSETRAGRLLLAKRLRPVRPEIELQNNRLSLESEGKRLCVKAM
jgi:DNA-binding MarR family transcriptional regulator